MIGSGGWMIFWANLDTIALGGAYTILIGWMGYRIGRWAQRRASRKEMNVAHTARELR